MQNTMNELEESTQPTHSGHAPVRRVEETATSSQSRELKQRSNWAWASPGSPYDWMDSHTLA
jgi:hypothetical protein